MQNIFQSKEVKLAIIAVFAIVIFFGIYSTAGAQPLDNIIFENEPLFSEVNFLPGEEITRWVRVTNVAENSRTVAARVDAFNDPDFLGGQLDISIKQGGTVLYAKTLTDFFNDGEIIFSSINPGETAQFDFNVIFKPATGNAYMLKSLTFDILVGFNDEPPPLRVFSSGSSGGLSSFSAITTAPTDATSDEAPPTPPNEGIIPQVLGIKLADTGFSNAEFCYLILTLLALFGIRALFKKSA